MKRWIALAACLLILMFLPQFFSTPLGKPVFLKAFGARLRGDVQIDSMRLSWFGPQSFKQVRIDAPQYQGTIEELRTDAPFWNLSKMSTAFTLQNGAFSFLSYGEGSLEQVSGRIQENELDLKGLSRLGSVSGQFAVKGQVYAPNRFAIEADVSNFPTAALDRLLEAKDLLYKGLGPSLTVKGTARLEGNEGLADFSLSSSNVQASIKAKLSEHAITLLEPLDAALKLTPELSEAVLSDVNPLFLTGLSANNPIYLHLSASDASIPLNPFSLEKLRLAGSLDMGRVQIRNGPTLASLVSLLKAGSLKDSGQMSAWFTSLDFHIQNGVVYTGRLDALLAGSIHICTWGSIDLLRDRLNMTLGIPADTLRSAFGIENLPQNYVVQVPIRGSTSHPEIEKGAATGKIAALAATQQIPLKKKTLLGGLIHAIAVPKEDPDVPVPKRPFPWERQ